MVSELEAAMANARRAGEGGPIDGFVARMADHIGAHATVKAVFGDYARKVPISSSKGSVPEVSPERATAR